MKPTKAQLLERQKRGLHRFDDSEDEEIANIDPAPQPSRHEPVSEEKQP